MFDEWSLYFLVILAVSQSLLIWRTVQFSFPFTRFQCWFKSHWSFGCKWLGHCYRHFLLWFRGMEKQFHAQAALNPSLSVPPPVILKSVGLTSLSSFWSGQLSEVCFLFALPVQDLWGLLRIYPCVITFPSTRFLPVELCLCLSENAGNLLGVLVLLIVSLFAKIVQLLRKNLAFIFKKRQSLLIFWILLLY